jgi:hypothetical protein
MPGSEFCWPHERNAHGKYTLLDISGYLEQVNRDHPKTCYDRPDEIESVWIPAYTIVYSVDELEQIDDFQLRFLYEFYHIDLPERNEFYSVLNGRSPDNPLAYLRQFNDDLVQTYYPIKTRLPYGSRELLIKGLLYYYRLIDKYGFNTMVTANMCWNNLPEYQRLKSTVKPLVIKTTAYADNDDFLEPFVAHYQQWFAEQCEQCEQLINIILLVLLQNRPSSHANFHRKGSFRVKFSGRSDAFAIFKMFKAAFSSRFLSLRHLVDPHHRNPRIFV